MAHEFLLPDVGEGLTEVVIDEWLIGVGEPVGLDAPLVRVETDKAVVDIPSPRAGVLLHQGARPGETLEVGAVLAVVGDQGETWEPTSSPTAAAGAPTPAAPIVGTLPEAPSGAVEALPAVRKLAAEMGVDLSSLAGSGPGGRVTRDDVLAAGSGPAERIPMSPTRRAIADRLARSWREIPHVTTYGSARAEPLLAARRELLAEAEGPMPLEALLVSLVIPLLRDHPEFNAAVSGTDIVLRKHYDIGIAADTDDGLMLPVLKGADTMSIHELADAIIRLAKSARGRTLTPDQVRGATFTLSNIGAVGGGFGTPIIPYGTSAILSVGRARTEAVVAEGEVVPGVVFPLSLSYDHRIIDGSLGREFMGRLVDSIEAAEIQ